MIDVGVSSAENQNDMMDVDSEQQNSNFSFKAKMFAFLSNVQTSNVTFDVECKIHCETSFLSIAWSMQVWLESKTSDINFEIDKFFNFARKNT